jgi:hypothetical protein
MLLAFDVLIGAGAFVSAYLWWLASRQRLRRVSRLEEFDAADINRILTAVNRSQILSSRAALAASFVAALASIRMIVQAVRDF